MSSALYLICNFSYLMDYEYIKFPAEGIFSLEGDMTRNMMLLWLELGQWVPLQLAMQP